MARLIAILGGLVTLISGVFTLISPFSSPGHSSNIDLIVNVATYGFLVLVLGLVALLASRHVSSLAWSVCIIGVGLLAYRFGANYLYNLGPILMVIAGIIGVAVRLA